MFAHQHKLHPNRKPAVKPFVLLCFALISQRAYTQDTLIFEVFSRHFNLGEMQAIHKPENQTDTYILESRFSVWSVCRVHYYLESTYKQDTMISSLAQITVNENTRHFCQVLHQGDFYLKKTTDKTDTLFYPAINAGITQLYFKRFNQTDSIFSEFEGAFIPFVKQNTNTFLLSKNKYPQQITFGKHGIEKITAPNPFLDFFIQLKY